MKIGYPELQEPNPSFRASVDEETFGRFFQKDQTINPDIEPDDCGLRRTEEACMQSCKIPKAKPRGPQTLKKL